MKTIVTLTLAGLVLSSLSTPVWAGKMPTEPLGGKPPAGSEQSIKDLDSQVKYQRAFEAVIGFMPAVAKYGLHRGTFEMGAGNNVVLAWSAGAKSLFEAGKTYELTVPKDVPINKLWSLTIYDMEAWAFIYSKEARPGLSSRDITKMNQNKDGSVTLYVGPQAPKGYENNWIPTSGKMPYMMFRFYGPEEAFYNKSFKLADVERVK